MDSNIDSCRTGTTSQSSVESSSPNPVLSSIEEEDDQHQRSISSPPQNSIVPYSSSSSSSFSDGEILDNELDGVSSTATTRSTGQFLWIDHHHPLPFLDHPPPIEDLRTRFASAYILTAEPSLTNELSLQHETSINECSIDLIDLIEEVSSAASCAIYFESLLNDEIGLHYMDLRSFKKEFSQENIEFWIECENFKQLVNQDEIDRKANSIWSTYLYDIEDGSCRLNIDNRTREECRQLLLNNPNIHIF
ncbi:unnamed protein product [Rotaria socialis]|uniref:RGS domain-containing protein n=1 Tax=Rotaria socialis TaxID=392032 RepID=A0A817NGJ4_9BILA|nr:unnamed protein product [Rotaria socialis]CAF4379327.1 unnamed protein product [Rotaria socialis]